MKGRDHVQILKNSDEKLQKTRGLAHPRQNKDTNYTFIPTFSLKTKECVLMEESLYSKEEKTIMPFMCPFCKKN